MNHEEEEEKLGDRDSNGDVFVVVTDNSDGSETRMILGSSGYTQKL